MRNRLRAPRGPEIRQNLRCAAQEVGTTIALRNIGTTAQLAAAICR
jgi:hypothetical protein